MNAIQRVMRRWSLQFRVNLAVWLSAAWLMPRIAGGDFGGGDEKEARRVEDVSRQREEFRTQSNQLLSQLIPGSEEYAQAQAEIVRLTNAEGPERNIFLQQTLPGLITQQQSRIASGGPATAQQAATMAREKQLRDVAAFKPEEQSIFSALRGLGLEGQQVASGSIFADLVSRAQDPNKYYQSTLEPKLALLQDAVKARAAQRGILGSGLELENLGRTGAELSIRETDAQEAFRQQQLNNFLGLFTAGQGLRNREIGLEGDLVNLQLGRESRLTDLLSQNTNFRLDDIRDLLGRQTNQSTLDRLDAEDTAAARRGQIGGAIGTGLGAAVGGIFGGPVGAGIGGSLGGQLGGGGGGGDVASLLGTQRAATTATGAPAPVSLSRAIDLQRNSGTSSTENARLIDELLRSLGNG